MDEIILLFEKILEFIKKLPLTDILVGVIVPITAAWISYYLAERAIRRKENNRLFIQIGLIQKELESNDKEITNFILAKYLYEKIKMFNQKSEKTKEDVLELYNDLILFNIDSDIIRNDYFDQEKYDLYYKTFEKAEGINEQLYELYEHYYKWIAVKERISKYSFNFKSKRWEENASDFVIINDSKLYILLVEFFEGLEVFGECNNNEEIFVCCGIWHEKIEDILKKLGKHEEKLRRKCK